MSDRTNFEDGRELIYQDFNKISSRMERFILDSLVYEILGRQSEGFFQDSFQVSRVSNNEVSVKAGFGLQNNPTDSSEPDRKPLILAANSSQIIPTADPTNDRIDLICVAAELVDGDTESRKFKDAFTSDITTGTSIVTKRWQAAIQIVQGIPAASPTEPTVPSGYIKVASVLVDAINGVTTAGNITDSRNILPLAGFSGTTGSNEYDAVVGDTSILGVSHSTLKAALDDANVLAGSKILVTRDESVANIPEIAKDNIEIVFKSGVTLSDGGSGTGLSINADGVRIKGGRFSGFTSGIVIQATKQYNYIENVRFAGVATPLSGVTGKNYQSGSIEE